MTENQLDVVAVGDAVIDLTAAGRSEGGNPLYEQNPGGGPANVVATVARLGGRAAFMGAVGDDGFGRVLRSALEDAGVDTEGLLYSATAGTRLVFIDLDASKERTFRPYASPRADLSFSTADLDLNLVAGSKILHTTMLANLFSPIREASAEAIRHAKSSGRMISFDPNWAASVSSDPRRERAVIEEVIADTDVLKLSVSELRFLLGDVDLARGTKLLLDAGPRLVVITLGEDGSCFRTAGAFGLVGSPSVDVVDTTGAGDAFFGALLFRIAAGVSSAEDLDRLSEATLRDWLAFANAAGASCASRRGSLRAVPDYSDVSALLSTTDERHP